MSEPVHTNKAILTPNPEGGREFELSLLLPLPHHPMSVVPGRWDQEKLKVIKFGRERGRVSSVKEEDAFRNSPEWWHGWGRQVLYVAMGQGGGHGFRMNI